mmetsp:Transcript_61281/g.189934  ORF Transcript_61281/g.189934 Transcript_61281/m.189934 type:complete len:258 (-) Transcript_61281:33-806(-)
MGPPHRRPPEHHQLPHLHGDGPGGQVPLLGRLRADCEDAHGLHRGGGAPHAAAQALRPPLPAQEEALQGRGRRPRPAALAGRGGRRGGQGARRPRRGVRVRGGVHPPDHRDHRVRVGHCLPHRLLPPNLGPVPRAPAALARLLPEDVADGLGDAVPSERHRSVRHVCCMVWHHAGGAHGHGRPRVLPPHVATPLGGVSEQVLQGRRREVRAVQHPGTRGDERVSAAVGRPKFVWKPSWRAGADGPGTHWRACLQCIE